MDNEINELLEYLFPEEEDGEAEETNESYSVTEKERTPSPSEANAIMQKHGKALADQMRKFEERRNGNDG